MQIGMKLLPCWMRPGLIRRGVGKSAEVASPPKINGKEPKNGWFVDVSPFPSGVFSGSSR